MDLCGRGIRFCIKLFREMVSLSGGLRGICQGEEEGALAQVAGSFLC
jgi:hypothetical protein